MENLRTSYGDKFLSYSPHLAKEYLQVFPVVLPILGEENMDQWTKIGLQMIGNNWRAWECALEYFRLSPTVLRQVDLIYAYKWATYGSQLAKLSPDVGVEYFRSSSFFLPKFNTSIVKSWVELGKQLISERHGSSKLAATFFRLSPPMIEEIGFSDFKEWAHLVYDIAKWGSDLALSYLEAPSEKLMKLPASLRLEILAFCRVLAQRSGKLALQYYHMSPDLFWKIPERIRVRAMELNRAICGKFPEKAVTILTLIQQTMRKISLEIHEVLLKQALKLAWLDGEVAQEFIVHLPRLVQLAPPHRLEDWFREGIAIAEKNIQAGIAFFSLESKTSLEILRKIKETVYLDDISRVLQLYTEGLSGKRVGVQLINLLPNELKGYSGQYPFTDGENIFLPPSSYELGSQAQNFMFYKLSTAHQAGYFEFGSFNTANQLGRFFKKFGKPQLAKDIYYIVEDSRIDFLLRHYYHGLRKPFQWMASFFLKKRAPIRSFPLQQAAMEYLVYLSTGLAVDPELPAVLRPITNKLRTVMSTIFSVQAEATDSLKVTEVVYNVLERIPNISLELLEKKIREGQAEALGLAEAQQALEASPKKETITSLFLEELENFKNSFPSPSLVGEEKYHSPEVLPYRGETKPELIQKLMKVREAKEKLSSKKGETFFPLSPEEL
ncbi:MAG: hypothetical protein HY730_03945, partial [Candidatus Tectomicrobia bacterium]|nr:hypothetical protein [Candidatus Tectomicrobia bacterium]